MLTVEVARKVGINACIDKIGREYVLSHKDCATSAYGECADGVYCFVGVDTEYRSLNSDRVLILDGRSRFSHSASCNVDLETGAVSFTTVS